MKKFVSLLLAMLVLTAMTGIAAAVAEGEYKDTIVWVIGNDQDNLDPQRNVSNDKVIPQFYNGLLGYDNEGKVVPKIAESYESSEDRMTWTFHLRQDVYFHSGRHCTAYDFEATFKRLLDEENPVRYGANFKYIKSAVATDDYTFVITLGSPKAFFLQSIASQATGVLNPEYIEKYGLTLGDTWESVDGTGPFKCVGWDPGEQMVFERFDGYYNGTAKTKTILMKIVPEQTSRAIAVETAQADIADGCAPDDVVRLDAVDGIHAYMSEGNGCHLFQFNCSTSSPVANPLVRRAIAYAIDREAICQYLYSGLGEGPMPNIMAPNVAGYVEREPVKYDPEAAKALLAEAGYPDGFDMSVMTTAVYNRGVEMGEIIKEMLGEVGINVNLEVVERAVFMASLNGLTVEDFNKTYGWDMFIMGSGGSTDADTLLYRIMHSDETNVNNYGFYRNAEVDELLEKGAVTMDPEERDACYARISDITLEEDPFGVYINWRKNVYVVTDKIQGMAVNPKNTMDLINLQCLAD